jgi:hypothetical protein
MSRGYSVMLRILLFSLFIHGGNLSAQMSTSHVKYDSDVLPSCIIKIDDQYWSWRDSLGASDEVESDLSKLYKNYLSLIKTEGFGDRSSEEAMCSAAFLMSPELTKVFNYFGGNVSPQDFYYQLIYRISEVNKKNHEAALNSDEFQCLVRSSIKEIESRFLDED